MIRVLIADDEGIERMALCRRLEKHFGDTLYPHPGQARGRAAVALGVRHGLRNGRRAPGADSRRAGRRG